MDQIDSHSQNTWNSLLITVEDPPDPAGLALAAGFDRVYANGRAEFASFLLAPAALAAASSGPAATGDDDLWRIMLLLPVVTAALQMPAANARSMAEAHFRPIPAAALPADLAETLAAGGAYRRTGLPADEALRLAEGFCAVFADGRSSDLLVRKCRQPWSDWFYFAPWDRTWLGLDRAAGRFWVLRATDTD